MLKKILVFILGIIILQGSYAQEDVPTGPLEKENIVTLFAKLIPNTGSFSGISNKARGRLLKTATGYEADRLSVLADTFKTENTVRDSHLADYISGGEKRPHPRIDLLNLKAQDGKATATLQINNIKKEVQITYKEKADHVLAEFEINTEDFQLPKASFLGVVVENKAKITAQFYWVAK